jgi:hypothetical protein
MREIAPRDRRHAACDVGRGMTRVPSARLVLPLLALFWLLVAVAAYAL